VHGNRSNLNGKLSLYHVECEKSSSLVLRKIFSCGKIKQHLVIPLRTMRFHTVIVIVGAEIVGSSVIAEVVFE
jgi:hypothetical protein